jgi:hypothetical protein
MSVKPDTCTERGRVDPTGTSVKVGCSRGDLAVCVVLLGRLFGQWSTEEFDGTARLAAKCYPWLRLVGAINLHLYCFVSGSTF